MPSTRPRSSFNPPPASSAGGTVPLFADVRTLTVSTHPPLRQRGEPTDIGFATSGPPVSTHPPLRQRGEQLAYALDAPPVEFQPTPRFVSGGNGPQAFGVAAGVRFQPTPRFVSG